MQLPACRGWRTPFLLYRLAHDPSYYFDSLRIQVIPRIISGVIVAAGRMLHSADGGGLDPVSGKSLGIICAGVEVRIGNITPTGQSGFVEQLANLGTVLLREVDPTVIDHKLLRIMNGIDGDHDGVRVDQLLPVSLGISHSAAQTAFLAVRDQAADVRVVQPDILFGHFLQDTHADITASQIIVRSVRNHSPADEEQPRDIDKQQKRLDQAEYR